LWKKIHNPEEFMVPCSHLTIFEVLTLTYFWWNELPLKFIEKYLDLGGLV
jgi:hypothetical protein